MGLPSPNLRALILKQALSRLRLTRRSERGQAVSLHEAVKAEALSQQRGATLVRRSLPSPHKGAAGGGADQLPVLRTEVGLWLGAHRPAQKLPPPGCQRGSQGKCVLINDRLHGPLRRCAAPASRGLRRLLQPPFPALPGSPGAQVTPKAGLATQRRARADRWENHQPHRVMIN